MRHTASPPSNDSRRSRFAARNNPGLGPASRLLVAAAVVLLCSGVHAQDGPSVQKRSSVLCVIDALSAIEPCGQKSEFKLSATRGGVESVIAPGSVFLHDILRSEP